MTTTLGERIIKAREALEFNQTEFAKKIGIAAPSLSLLETGASKTLQGRTLYGMILAGANPDYIMKGIGPLVLPERERRPKAQALLNEYEGMSEENRDALIEIAKALRRNQSPNNPGPAPS